MNTTDERRSALVASRPVLASKWAAHVLAAIATVTLFVALWLPWWSVRVEGFVSNLSGSSTNGFSGWGWMSFIAVLVVAALASTNVAAIDRPLAGQHRRRVTAWVLAAAGVADLLGSVMSVANAPKSEISVSIGTFVSVGPGLIMALVSGVLLIASGVLMLVQPKEPRFLSHSR